ncbi:MAG: hypothetical protein K8R88_03505 [Armatimonadetes bacterium]|nr:hypothetical protein [Armatimonadota bacterium]
MWHPAGVRVWVEFSGGVARLNPRLPLFDPAGVGVATLTMRSNQPSRIPPLGEFFGSVA